MKTRWCMVWLVSLVFWVVTACGGGSSSSGLGSANQLTGTVFAPSGTSAVAGATVYVPSASTNIAVGQGLKAVTDSADDGTACDDPPEAACASTCSQADGSFGLSVTGCDASQTTGKIVKGSFTKTFTISCSGEGSCAIAASDTKLSATSTSMAVVSGAYDSIEDVLAKLGFGELETASSGGRQNRLKVGTEKFAVYRGGGSIDTELTDTTKYKTATALFTDVTEMKKYSIIFVNCGADESLVSSSVSMAKHAGAAGPLTTKAPVHSLGKGLPSGVITNLQTYVQDGGRLYVTDLAYDYIEQAFPSVMDFEGGSSGDSSTAETDGAAELGTSGIASDATVNDATMKSWLAKQSSNTVTASSTTPNSSSCTTTENGNSTALNSDGTTIRIGDFLAGWAVMNAKYSGSDTKVWLEGPVTFSGSSGTTTRPLTVTKAVGSGKVLYSSYHTSHSCPTTGEWPQERVLQYLVFEVAD